MDLARSHFRMGCAAELASHLAHYFRSELSASLAEAGTDVGVDFLPSWTCKGAIRVSSRERGVLRVGNKACDFLVGNETPTGVWENKPADFLDMKLVQYVSQSWCDHLVTQHVSVLLHQQKKRKREYGKPRLGGLNLPITRQHRKPIYEKRSYEKHCFLLSSPYPEPFRWLRNRDGSCSFTSTWSGERKAAYTKGW